MKNIITAFIIALGLVTAAMVYVSNAPESTIQFLGNAADANIATSTTSTLAGVHQVLKTEGGFVDFVTVASSSASTFELWNATSTTDSASTSVMKLKAAVAEGTYDVRADFPRGIIINPATGFNGQYTTTWR